MVNEVSAHVWAVQKQSEEPEIVGRSERRLHLKGVGDFWRSFFAFSELGKQ